MKLPEGANLPFNQLSPAEAERLALLAEELGEAIQAIGKILRHGYESRNPDEDDGFSNRDRLEAELGDVLASIDLLVSSNDLIQEYIDHGKAHKLASVGRWMHHQEKKQ